VVDKNFISNHLFKEILFKFLKFETQNFQRMSDRQMTKTKVVELDDIYIFLVETFFI
jgi:Iap family predicted aminopeptidase